MSNKLEALINPWKVGALFALISVAALSSAQVNANSVADRFNELRNSLNSVEPVTVDNQSDLDESLFNDAALQAATTWTETYDDSILRAHVGQNEESINALREYTNSLNAGLRHALDSEISMLLQFAAKEALEAKQGAEYTAAALDSSLNASLQNQFLNMIASLRTDLTALIDLKTKQTDARISNLDSFYRSEFNRLEEMIHDQSKSSPGRWVPLYQGSGVKELQIPDVAFSKFRLSASYRTGFSHHGVFDAPLTTYGRETDSSSEPEEFANAWCLPTEDQRYLVEWTVPVPERGMLLKAPADAESELEGSCLVNGDTNSRGVLRDFVFTNVEILVVE